MKIGVFTVLFAQRPFEEALDFIKEAGCEAVEIGTGGHPGGAHCDLDSNWYEAREMYAYGKSVDCVNKILFGDLENHKPLRRLHDLRGLLQGPAFVEHSQLNLLCLH